MTWSRSYPGGVLQVPPRKLILEALGRLLVMFLEAEQSLLQLVKR